MGVKEERYRQPWWLGNYSFSKINVSTLTIDELSPMQYGHALDRILWKMFFADPALGPVYMLKANVSNGF